MYRVNNLIYKPHMLMKYVENQKIEICKTYAHT